MGKPLHRRRSGAVFRSSDDKYLDACGDIAYIDGKRVKGEFFQREVKVLLGGGRAGADDCVYYFEFRLCDCPTITCGSIVKVNAMRFKVGEGGLSKPDIDGYVKAYLNHCRTCPPSQVRIVKPKSEH